MRSTTAAAAGSGLFLIVPFHARRRPTKEAKEKKGMVTPIDDKQREIV